MDTARLWWVLLVVPLLLAAGDHSSVPKSSAISQETHRTRKAGNHVVTLWWLPVEYWEAAARELGKPEEEMQRVRARLADYVVLGLVDAQVSREGTLRFRSFENTKESLVLVRDERELPPADRLDPGVRRLLPELAYFMTAGLGVMSEGLRLVLFPNVNEEGRRVMSASTRGQVEARYTPEGTEPISLVWRAPLTAVVGPRRCPKGGEELEADWNYCPWHGVPSE
jgi:hypothetical protein